MPDRRTYPHDDFDRLRVLQGLLGSFWSSYFHDKEVVYGLFKALQTFYRDWEEAVEETAACVNRKTIPVYRKRVWLPLILLESEAGGIVDVARYGQGGLYGGSLTYGAGVREAGLYRFSLRTAVKHIPLISNRVSNPSFVACAGTDFHVESGRLVLAFDPFLPGRGAVREVEGSREALYWAYGTLEEAEYLWYNLGYTLGLRGASSAAYRDLLNAVTDAHVSGPTASGLTQAVAAMAGAELAAETEAVIEVLPDIGYDNAVTEKRVYQVPAGSVEAGAALVAGLPVAGGFRVARSADRAAVTAAGGLTLPAGFFNGLVSGPLHFGASPVALTYEGVTDGLARVRFQVNGAEADVEAFWAAVRARETAAGKALADWLDRRSTKIGVPQAQHLPSVVVPCEIIAPFIGAGLLTVSIPASTLRAGRFGFSGSKLLREATSPRLALFISLELSVPGDSVTLPDSDEVQGGVALELPGDTVYVYPGVPVATRVRGVLL